ncbi:MAG: aminotransferase class V-fold PLP-dependent enzyme [Ilumatobacter sp.]
MTHPFVEHDGVYLLSHSVGLPIAGSRHVAQEYFDTWEHHTADAWPRWLDGIDHFRRALAGLLSTTGEQICPQSNVSSGLTKVLDAQRHRFDRPTILISEDAFPSLGFVCERSGYEVRFVPTGADVRDPAVWSRYGGGVDVAVITHVHSNTGVSVPVAEIAAPLRDAGVFTIVDVAQSIGILPIDVASWDVDVIVGSCVKWLSGGPGAGWLWASESATETSVPTDVGWWSHEEPFEFDIHDYRDAPDALRFWGGSPTVLPFLVAAHSISSIDAIGVDAIRDHNLGLLDHLIDRLGEQITSPHDRARRSGTAIVRSDARVVATVQRHGIDVDHREHGIRVSPHLHTSIDDIDRLIDALDA